MYWLKAQHLEVSDALDTFMRKSEFEEFVAKGHTPLMMKHGKLVPVRTIEDYLIIKHRKYWKKTPSEKIDEFIAKRKRKELKN